MRHQEHIQDHLKIAEYIIQQIKNNEILPGQKVPSQHQLVERFRVDRNVVRRALTRLENLGWVVPVQGKGCYANKRPPVVTSVLTRFEDTRFLNGDQPVTHLVEWCLDEPTTAERENLKLTMQDKVYRVETLRFSGTAPLNLATASYPEKNFPEIETYLSDSPSFSNLLFDLHKTNLSRKFTIIEARMPTEREAELLEISQEIPIVQSISVRGHPDGTPATMVIGRARGDRCQYVIDFENTEN
ncbi:GntR family transcriptional regulator [Paenibacillus terrae HPL-003]|uniref:GntR family transcriptional regulator n=1 Tax=Paenibacillus terrae (strain HPL-003) TaxID=985665 RepID=G7VPS3_PAETH|nr:GntR family transcriptional regulator [Paenibacillus terrae]AET61071.1 GntR family transcriptional regulator [Paenibacillus terrae HPL-003]